LEDDYNSQNDDYFETSNLVSYPYGITDFSIRKTIPELTIPHEHVLTHISDDILNVDEEGKIILIVSALQKIAKSKS
jgi:hypothetical protein